MVGGAIYFATTIEDTYRKARYRGPVLECRVRIGRVKRMSSWSSHTWASLFRSRYDSIFLERDTGWEVVVFQPDQVEVVGYAVPPCERVEVGEDVDAPPARMSRVTGCECRGCLLEREYTRPGRRGWR